MKLYLLFLILLIPGVAMSQQYSRISGKVFDAETGEPVADVNVVVKSNGSGTITGAGGVYTASVKATGDTLMFSHVRYASQEYAVQSLHINHNISLEPMLHMLPPAEVRPVFNVSRGMLLDVSDYTFVGDSILYVGYCYRYGKDKNPWLVMMGPQGDTVFTHCVGIEGNLFRDCLGNIHYLTEKSAFQLVFAHKSVELAYQYPIKKFNEAMQPCKLESMGKLLFGEYAESNQVLFYYYTDTISLQWEMFRTIADERKLEMLAFQGLFFSMGQKGPDAADLRFEKMMMYKPVFAPVVKANDTIAIINYTDSLIEWYTPRFEFLGSIGISFQNNRFIENQIVVDNTNGKVYAVFLRNGKTVVRQIFLHNGSLGPDIHIPDFYWIDNIQVHRGKLYFLYREKYTGDLRSLYRMNLE